MAFTQYTDSEHEVFDVAIIGGGPAGLMAAIAARQHGAKTILLEKGDKLGRKLGISGGGRCNVTNAKPLPELMKNIPGNSRFLYSALTQFGNENIIAFVEGLGIRVKEEDRGRVFPVSDKAATVVDAFVSEVYRLGTVVQQDSPVKKLLVRDGAVSGVLLRSGQRILSRTVIVAAGGCSVPKTGSTGDAYPWARSVGHTIVEPYPTEVPLTSDVPFIRKRTLQGLSLRGVNVSVWNERHKRLTTESGDLLFTHLGLSGPAALRCSHYVSTALRKNPNEQLSVTIDCLPTLAKDAFLAYLQDGRKSSPRRHIGNHLTAILPDRLVHVVLQNANVPPDTQLANLSQEQLSLLTRGCKEFPVPIKGTLPLAQATVTGGGVSVKEINPSTMSSKLCEGLFFAGEVMDVHAHTGGYNITVAFSTGHLAGTSAAEFALSFVPTTAK